MISCKMHQYRLIRPHYVTDGMRKHIPRLIPYMNKHIKVGEYDSIFGHELGHCMEMVYRGQKERLALPNFGWPLGNPGKHTIDTAEVECRTFAFQYLLEEMFTGRIDNTDLLCISSVDIALQSALLWKDQSNRDQWRAAGKPKDRIQEYMKKFRPIMQPLLDETIDYIIDNTDEFLEEKESV